MECRTSSLSCPQPVGRLWGSLLWILAGVFFGIVGQSIPRESFAGAADPGPALVPLIGAGLLLLGGLIDAVVVVLRYAMHRQSPNKSCRDASPSASERATDGVDASIKSSADLRNSKSWQRRLAGTMLPMTAVLVWGIALPWLGFAISCWCFVASWLWFSRAPWWQVFLVPTLLDGAILLLFGQLFEVQLPRGFWGWP